MCRLSELCLWEFYIRREIYLFKRVLNFDNVAVQITLIISFYILSNLKLRIFISSNTIRVGMYVNIKKAI